MSKLPVISRKHKICVICEGLEEVMYFDKLVSLNVFSKKYEFILINAKSESKIFARFQNAYNNDAYELIIIFCDTDKYPYREYSLLKKKLNQFFDKRNVSQKLVIWANPCSMQIILSHFGDVKLEKQGKKTNAAVIEQMTGVSNYDGHEYQIREICRLIFQRSYSEMKKRLTEDDYDDERTGTSNICDFLVKFEDDNAGWIATINRYLEK